MAWSTRCSYPSRAVCGEEELIRRDGLTLWPAYFDRRLPRGRGRRVPTKLAIDSPSTATIAEACKKLGLEYEVNEGAYPKAWWRKTGYIVVKVPEGMSKTQLIRRIAESMRRQK